MTIKSTLTKTVRQYGSVGVLYGGTSAERQISLMTGTAVYQALTNLGISAHLIDVGDDISQQLEGLQVERIFIALHGPGGEDGTVQSVLDDLKIPYTGSGVASSALAMDKKRSKELWQEIGLPTSQFVVLNKDTDWVKTLHALGGKSMVKPASEGSSIGMSRVTTPLQLQEAWAIAAEFDTTIIAEPLLEGNEYTVAILNGRVLPSIRISADHEFYDYDAKYYSDETSYFCPSGLSAEREQEIQQISLAAFRSLGCEGWGRVDIMTDEMGQFQLLEVNTVPGMTSHSLVPMAAAAVGLDFDQLVFEILKASCDE
ncbi:MAG: D-alanine--D-alanine ligase [Porticoccaceae bacterium]|nr:D-alanine--D-alanine ligase [Porticoccaceae bacterium]MDG1475130.1 D-alanine--D-alanine ligase [Porticoccaceae bacterium]